MGLFIGLVAKLFSHDNIADILGVPAQSLKQMYEDATKDFMRTVNQYIKQLRTTNSAGVGAGAGAGADPLAIKLDSDGFPIIPSPASWNKVTKEKLEKMYRSYMAQHYSTYVPVIHMPVIQFFSRACIRREAPAGSIYPY